MTRIAIKLPCCIQGKPQVTEVNQGPCPSVNQGGCNPLARHSVTVPTVSIWVVGQNTPSLRVVFKFVTTEHHDTSWQGLDPEMFTYFCL